MFSYAAAAAEWLRRADRHRNLILAVLLGKVAVEAAFGILTSPTAVAILVVWLTLAMTVGRAMAGVDDVRRRVQLRTLIVIGDIGGAATTQYFAGGTAWLGTSAYFFLLAVSAVALPGRVLAVITALSAVAYGIPLFGETFGWLPPHPLSGALAPAPTPVQAVTVWVFMALMLTGVSALLHAFVRLVRQGGEWHQTLVEQAPVMIGTLDRTGRITAANPAAADGFGVAHGALVGRSFHAFVPATTEPTVGPRFAMVLAGRAQQFDTQIRRADGVERWVNVVAHPLTHGGRSDDVRDVLCLVRDVTEARAAAEALAHQAYHDALTGLANRVRFCERLDDALARAERAGEPERVAVLVLDLDGFKTVNDSLGHAAGDALLVEVSARLLDATRGSDTVARLGGDEFAVLLERVQEDADAITAAERVLAAMGPAFTVEGRRAFVGTSIGIARGAGVLDGEGDAPVATLLRNADAAMYRAKAQGKGRWACFEPDMHDTAVRRLALAADLRQALEREELYLVFQPIVALDTGRAVGVEALVRWRHPERGLVPPSEFIPFAEEAGLIVPLGRWVLGEACRHAARWRASEPGGRPMTVAVNVSGQQVQHPEFVAEVLDVLRDTGLPAHALTLEITEYSVVEQPDVMRERLTTLRAHGVQVAIDDFGTGYSALGHLQQFPLDVLKIDRAFVDRVTRGGPPAAVTRTLVALGEALALRTVAEGIETEAQRAHLASIGCPYGQGYLFARPLDAADVAAWMSANAGEPHVDEPHLDEPHAGELSVFAVAA